MEEKIYKTMSGSGALGIAVGVVVLVVGVASGETAGGKIQNIILGCLKILTYIFFGTWH